MTKKRYSCERPSDEKVIINKIEILTDDAKRGWFPFRRLEPDEKWYSDWWFNREDLKNKKKILDLIHGNYIKTNFTGDGIIAVRVYVEDGYYEHHYCSYIK